jgi:hypothetical protein
MDVEAFVSFLFAIASHIEAADEPLGQILRQFLQPVLLHLPDHALVELAVLPDGLQVLGHVSGIILDKIDASRQQWRHHDVNLRVSLHVGQIPHEIAKLAAGLGLLKTQLSKPRAKHANGEIHIRTDSLDVLNEFVPLLSLHNLPYSVSVLLVLVDFNDAQGLVA